MTEEFIKLQLTVNNKEIDEYHAHIIKDKSEYDQTNELKKDEPGLNIVMIMIDSISNANFQRHMTKTYKYLNEDNSTFIMKVRRSVHILLF